ncbi:uncharacterized protein T551_00815 [Pneumocystis jirovecii RU7]|uniref:Uncharacterized protein n=1 Tax=Pneumocystis jirovecii (strain RU7) TaxID=1408657 RepID=A0A0W4ZUT7_PNEJ7|nr:uncharacterized protein T551_00815 [Pneumocystis jirovecii RU7]KTW32133.1 hypothetical protein T551_00815 [Pneumocystis jirovecii RU7]
MSTKNSFQKEEILSSPSSKNSNNDDFFSFEAIITKFKNKSHERRKKKHNEIQSLYLKNINSIEKQLKSIIEKNKAKIAKQNSQKIDQLKHLLKRKKENEQMLIKEVEAIEVLITCYFRKLIILDNFQ